MSETSKQSTNIVTKIIRILGKIVKSFFRFIFKNKAGQALAVVAILVLAGYLLYSAGERAGVKKQIAADKKSMSSNKTGLPPGLSNTVNLKRKSIVGNVVNVSAKSIEVKPKNGETVKAKIDEDTTVYGVDRKKTDYKAIKKDQLVYITANIEDDKSNTATRIRIQK